MIDVPQYVKDLFTQDSISKNFRVHFPNGEYRDLTNSDIVAESVVFTESIGSTNGLKFGLCEGATLEFQTSLNENIRNKQIETFIEVDVSSVPGEAIEDFGLLQDESVVDSQSYMSAYNGNCAFTFRSGIQNSHLDITFKGETYALRQFETVTLPMEVGDTAIVSTSGEPEDDGDYLVYATTATFDILPEDAQTSTDIPYPFYRIPYGTFYVDSCKRDATNNIRKIVAYQNKWEVTGVGAIINLTDAERIKFGIPVHPTSSSVDRTYKQDVLKFLISNTQDISLLGIFDDISVTQEIIATDSTREVQTDYAVGGRPYAGYVSNDWEGHFPPSIDIMLSDINGLDFCNSASTVITDGQDYSALYVFEPTILKTLNDIVDEMFNNSDFVNYVQTYFTSKTLNEVRDDIANILKEKILKSCTVIDPNSGTSYSGNLGIPAYGVISDYDKPFIVYPYVSNFYESNASYYKKNSMGAGVPRNISISCSNPGGGSSLVNFYISNISMFDATKYTFDSGVYLKFERNSYKGTTLYTRNWYNTERVLNDESKLALNSLIGDIAELQGKFIRLDRATNEVEYIDLSSQSEICNITKSLWKSVWYEDKAHTIYDKVVCNFKDANNLEVAKSVDIVDTTGVDYEANLYQHYDISSNYYIKNNLLTEAKIDEVMTLIATLLRDIQYYIMDIDMRGLPYLEAGDAIEVETNEATITTVAMRHRLSGIHSLMDNIEIR